VADRDNKYHLVELILTMIGAAAAAAAAVIATIVTSRLKSHDSESDDSE